MFHEKLILVLHQQEIQLNISEILKATGDIKIQHTKLYRHFGSLHH